MLLPKSKDLLPLFFLVVEARYSNFVSPQRGDPRSLVPWELPMWRLLTLPRVTSFLLAGRNLSSRMVAALCPSEPLSMM